MFNSAGMKKHGDSVSVCNVPGLDDIVEQMLRKRHSATSSWGKRLAVTLTTHGIY